MDKNQADHSASEDVRQVDSPQHHAAPPELGGQPRYCMRCGKRFATHIKLGSRGRKQYRCDECFEGKKKI